MSNLSTALAALNTMTDRMATASHQSLIHSEAAYCGRNLANALRGPTDCTEDEAAALGCPTQMNDNNPLYLQWTMLCTKSGWSAADRDEGWTTAVDAYYNRMTGKD